MNKMIDEKFKDLLKKLQGAFDAPPDPPYPPPKYARLLAAITDIVQDTLKSGRMVIPVMHIMKDGKLVDLVTAPFESNEDKNYFAQLVRQTASKHNADALVLLSEVWSLSVSVDKHDKRSYDAARQADKYPSLEDHPDRIDALMVQLETREGHWLGTAEIKPAKKGRKIGGLSWRSNPDRATGRFTNLLPVEYATPAQADAYLNTLRTDFMEKGMNPDRAMSSGITLMQLLESAVRQAPKARLTDKSRNIIVSVLHAFYPYDDERQPDQEDPQA